MERLDVTPDGTRGGRREGVEVKCRGKVRKKSVWQVDESKLETLKAVSNRGR